jgi:hypothetical protein
MNSRRLVMPLIVSASLPVQTVCSECGIRVALLRLAGGQAPSCDALLGSLRPGLQRRAREQGKIKGRGTWARRMPCLHRGKGGTHQEWQRAVRDAKPAMALRLARASFAGLRQDWPDSAP